LRLQRYWEGVTREHPSSEVLWEEHRLARIRYRGKLRIARILIERFFVGRDRELLTLVQTSATPVEDAMAIYGVSHVVVYRQLNYLSRVLAEYVDYFQKRTHRAADLAMRQALSRTNYGVFKRYVRCRDPELVAASLGITGDMARYRVRRIDKTMKALVAVPAVFDLFVLWRRVKKIRRTFYGGDKRLLKGPELGKEE